MYKEKIINYRYRYRCRYSCRYRYRFWYRCISILNITPHLILDLALILSIYGNTNIIVTKYIIITKH